MGSNRGDLAAFIPSPRRNLPILKGYPKAPSGVRPLYSPFTARDLTTATFQAALMVVADLPFSHRIALSRAYIEATSPLTLSANLLLQSDMGFPVNLVFI
jgi:hypothetical protein